MNHSEMKIPQNSNEAHIDQPMHLSEHLIALENSPWALWRLSALRGAGFPVDEVFKLASKEYANAADRVLRAEGVLQQTRDAALQYIDHALDVLRQNQEWDNREQRDRLIKAKHLLHQKKFDRLVNAAYLSQSIEEAVSSSYLEYKHAWQTLRQIALATQLQVSQSIYDIAHTERFREAVIWQNRQAIERSITSLQKPSASSSHKQRRNEELIAMYLQRYCTKSDVIGFFGPVGWAKFYNQQKSIVAQPGPNLLKSRSVYFEAWGIIELAQTLAKNNSLLPWFAPYRAPFVYLDGTTLLLPFQEPIQLSPEQAAVLTECDGNQTAKLIAQKLIQNSSTKFQHEEEIYEQLERLRQRELVTWTLEIPVQPDTELLLRLQLERIEEEVLRRPALDMLDELEKARTIVAQSAGKAEELHQALHNLDETFTRITGASATRLAGEMYAARTLVYEDCLRDIRVELGTELLSSLKDPLSLLLTSGRWFTFEVAEIARSEFYQAYRELTQFTNSKTINATLFLARIQPLFVDKTSRPFDGALPAFQQRWADILSLPADQHHVHYTSKNLYEKVMAAFDMPRRTHWSFTRYHSPDIMIAAESVEAIQQGKYQLILGEIHLGFNTLKQTCYLSQHPHPEEFLQSLDQDTPEPQLILIPPRYFPNLTARTLFPFIAPKDFRLIITNDAFSTEKSHAFTIGELVVEEIDKQLVVRTRDGKFSFDLMEVVADLMGSAMPDPFKLLLPINHLPRISIDRLVVCRETWQFDASDMPFIQMKDTTEQFVAARRWRYVHGIPRFVFIKLASERKPFYVDFDSPIYLDIFMRSIQRETKCSPSQSSIVITEMLPEPTHNGYPMLKAADTSASFGW